MEVRGAGEPRQEAGVLHRVPPPHAAPAEHLVAPPSAEQDPDGQEPPGVQRPSPGGHQPALTDTPGDQRGDGEGERDREPDVAEIQDRRVEQDEDVVLQQRVGAEAAAVEVGDRAALEGVDRAEGQEEEECRHREHHHQRPGDQRVIEPVAVAAHDHGGVDGEDQQPQQDAALERAPQGRDVEQRRRVARADLLDVVEGEVAGDQRPLHHRDGDDRAAEGQPGVVGDRTQQPAIACARRRPPAPTRRTRLRRVRRSGPSGR